MTELQKRILSAAILTIITTMVFVSGESFAKAYIFSLGIFLNDEIITNFFCVVRKSMSYLLTQGLYSILCAFYFLFPQLTLFSTIFLGVAVLSNILLFCHLVMVGGSSAFIQKISQKYPSSIFIYIFSLMVPLFQIVSFENWKIILAQLLVINFSMDIGAWFFGINFGKNPLYPRVSPKKTVEGLIGGVFLTVLVGLLFDYIFFHKFIALKTLFFAFLGITSQMGDLVQSMIKRQFHLKDSSNLIPGHGGVYDRIDGLIFVTPFLVLVYQIWGIH